MSPRGEQRLALALFAGGGGLALLAAPGTWAEATVSERGLPQLTVALTGADLAPGLAALGLLALAGVLAVLATRGVARRAAGGLLALTGLALLATAVRAGRSLEAAALGPLADRLGVSEVYPSRLAGSAWWSVAALGGVLVAAGGLLVLTRGARWPALSVRYQAPGARTAVPPTTSSTAQAWDAIDRGEDPTLDPRPGPDLPQ